MIFSLFIWSCVEWLRPLALVCVLASHKLILCEVKDNHVIKLFGQLEDSTEDVHLLTPNNSSVTAASDWFESILVFTNLIPLLGAEVKCP